MTLPKDYGDKEPMPPKTKGTGGGKKIAAGVGGAVAALLALGVVGSAYQPTNSPSQNIVAPLSDPLLPASEKLIVIISYVKDPISRGSTQTIRISVEKGDAMVSGAIISGMVTYASGLEKPFGGTTNAAGHYSYSWQIVGNSDTGRFNVKVKVTDDGQNVERYSSFSVVEA